MKQITLFFAYSYIVFFQINAQSVAQWAKDFGTIHQEFPQQLCSDELGNVYLGGAYYEDFVMCNDTLPNTIHPANIIGGHYNLFIAKYNANGNCVWTKVGAIHSTHSNAFTNFKDIKYYKGYIYCVGSFRDSIIFDNQFPCSYGNVGRGTFLLKMDTNGNIIWHKTIASATHIAISSIVPYDDGLFLAGDYLSAIKIDSVELYAPNYTRYFSYIAKINNAGKCEWAKNITSSNDSLGCYAIVDMEYDKAQNLYIAGHFIDTLNFSTQILYDSISKNGGLFVAKFDTLGNFIWAKGGMNQITGGLMFINHTCYHDSGYLYIAMQYIDSIKVNTTNFITNVPNCRYMLIKIDTLGQIIWGKTHLSSTNSNMQWMSIEANSQGFLLYSSFKDTIIIDNHTMVAIGNEFNNLLTQYDTNGHLVWHKYFGSIPGPIPYASNSFLVACDMDYNQGNIYISAITEGICTIDTFALIGQGSSDILIASLKDTSFVNPVINEIQSQKTIIIFPNPTLGKINIELGQKFPNIEVCVFNSMGQNTFKNTYNYTDNINLLIEGTKGIYLLSNITVQIRKRLKT